MAVARSDSGTNTVTGSQITSLTLTTLTVGSGANQYGLILVCTGALLNSATWNGVAASSAINVSLSAGANILSLWQIVAPATGNVVASWTGSFDAELGASSFSGVNQTTPRVVVDDFTDAPAANESVESHNEPSAANDATYGGYDQRGGTINSVNQTQLFINNTNVRIIGANYALGGTTNTMSCTFAASAKSGGLFIHIQAAAAAAGSVVSPRLLGLLGVGS